MFNEEAPVKLIRPATETLTLWLAIFLAVGIAAAQSTAKPAAAANAWMKLATDPGSPDPVSGTVRQQRDSHFDASPLASKAALTPESAPLHHVFPGAHVAGKPEIAETSNRAVVIATFTGYRSVLTASGREVYTEVTFHVSNVFQDVSGRAARDSDITVALRGGTVKTADGKVISYLTDPRSYFIQPQRTYLLVLSHHADGDFYSRAGDWDISDGVVRANSDRDSRIAQQGKSALVGLTKDQLIRLLNQRFSTKN
jgi:hypothetical protein